jgi:tetratricopeptide (TPR) repeat protein
LPDLVLVETHNLLGSCAAQDGDYARAISHFQDGVDCCDKLGREADAPHCNLLLNIALLHKAQGDVDRALPACKKAREVYQRFAPPDDLGFAAIDAATALLLTAQVSADRKRAEKLLEEANGLAESILQRSITGGPVLNTAYHCRALFHLFRRDFSAAETNWNKVKELQGGSSPLPGRQ